MVVNDKNLLKLFCVHAYVVGSSTMFDIIYRKQHSNDSAGNTAAASPFQSYHNYLTTLFKDAKQTLH